MMDKTMAERTNYKEYKMDEAERLKELKINPLHYIQLKEENYTDSQIAKEWEMDTTKLHQKKDHWKFVGIKPDSMMQILKKKTTKAQRESMKKAIDGELPSVEAAELESLPEGTTVLNDEATRAEIEKESTIDKAESDSPERMLQQTIDELREHLQVLTNENSDLNEENQKLSRAKEGISQDYEKLQEDHDELVQQCKDMQYQLQNTQSKQTTYVLEEKLEETYRELQAAQKELKDYAEANEVLQNEKNKWVDNYIDEKRSHESLSVYTKRLMPS